MLTTSELLTFVTIIETGSLSAAARILQKPSSGVTRELAALEKKLQITLITRTTRRLALTPEGAVFFPESQRDFSSDPGSRRSNR